MENSTLEKLQRHEKMTDEECFSITLEISKGLNAKGTSTNTLARNLLIRVLDNWNNIPESYKTIFRNFLPNL